MLDFLVTSTARRRLLLLFWGRGESGHTKALSEKVGVAYAAAQRELKEMERLGWVTTSHHGKQIVYAANPEFEGHDLLVKLAQFKGKSAFTSKHNEQLYADLKALGAPLDSRKMPSKVPLSDVLLAATKESETDPTVARVMPLVLLKVSKEHTADLLAVAESLRPKSAPETLHRLGFLAALADSLASNKTLKYLARKLRDDRRSKVRPFFRTKKSRENRLPLAAEWGYGMEMDEETFRSTLEKASE